MYISDKSFSCYIITETTLGTQCGEILLIEGQQVLGVVSSLSVTLCVRQDKVHQSCR